MAVVTLSLATGDVEASAQVRVFRDAGGRCAELEDEPLVDGVPMSRLGLSMLDEARVVDALCDAAFEG